MYAGSSEGCGCCFSYVSAEEWERQLAEVVDAASPEELKLLREGWLQDRKSVDDLRAYLAEITKAGPVRVLVTWVGEESTLPHRVLAVTPDYFGGESFDLEEFTLFDVNPQ